MALSRPNSHFVVAPGVHGYRSVMVNFFIIRASPSSQDWILVDAGLKSSPARIELEVKKLFGQVIPPRAIVLTHGHFDHIGALPRLQRDWDVPTYAHPRELPYLNQRRLYPSPDPTVGGGMMARTSFLYPKQAPKLPHLVLPLPQNGRLPGMEDWQWIETPGHSPGHVSFFRAKDRTLIAGDAIVTTRQESLSAVYKQEFELRPPPAYFTPDWAKAFESMKVLHALRPENLATGHGLPAHGSLIEAELATLLENFESMGLPANGKYVRRTWPSKDSAVDLKLPTDRPTPVR